MLKLKKRVLFIFVGLLFITSITYSRWISFGKINLFTHVASWSLKINGQDVSSSSTFTLDKIVWSENQKVADGYVAPGGSGYYEIKVDTSDTKVAVDYTIGLDLSAMEENTRMKVSRVTLDDEEVIFDQGYYDGFISLADVLNNKVLTFRVYIQWSETNNDVHDYLDVQSVLDYGNIELPIVVMVKQHIENTESNSSLVTQLLPYKEFLLEVPRPTLGVTITPYYHASLDALCQNPERGMYNSDFLVLTKSDNAVKDMQAKVSKLLYLKVDLSSFSAWRNGVDEELSQNAIDTLKMQLENIKQHDNTVLLRFVYDNNETGIYNDNKTKFEPEQIMLLRHIEQLKDVFQEYSTTIYTRHLAKLNI